MLLHDSYEKAAFPGPWTVFHRPWAAFRESGTAFRRPEEVFRAPGQPGIPLVFHPARHERGSRCREGHAVSSFAEISAPVQRKQRCVPALGEGGDLVAVGVVQHGTYQQVVHVVTGLAGMVGTQNGVTDQVQVANGIECLVFGELVAIAQAVGVEHAVVIHHDGVVEAAAQGQADTDGGPPPRLCTSTTSSAKVLASGTSDCP